MRVLLTRAKDDAARTAEQLAAMGHEAIISPVIDIVLTGATWPDGVSDAVIATSARAFRSLHLAPQRPLPEVRRLLPLFLVGANTGEAARAAGFEGPFQIAVDAKTLYGLILDRVRPASRVLYLAGRERKSFIEDACAAAGLNIEVVETYSAPAAEILSEEATLQLAVGAIGAVLHYSRRSAEIFLRLAEAAALDPGPVQHAAISEDAAAPLKEAALPRVTVAATPDEASILALLTLKSVLLARQAILPPEQGKSPSCGNLATDCRNGKP